MRKSSGVGKAPPHLCGGAGAPALAGAPKRRLRRRKFGAKLRLAPTSPPENLVFPKVSFCNIMQTYEKRKSLWESAKRRRINAAALLRPLKRAHPSGGFAAANPALSFA
ncbi:MAG: hypothetical protein ACI4KR_07680 [Ruminiclostridium sp.]